MGFVLIPVHRAAPTHLRAPDRERGINTVVMAEGNHSRIIGRYQSHLNLQFPRFYLPKGEVMHNPVRVPAAFTQLQKFKGIHSAIRSQ